MVPRDSSVQFRLPLLLAVFFIQLAAAPAMAATVTGLYEATVRVVDRSERSRDAAFAEALGVVAVRVSGNRDAPARLGAALAEARRHVQRYGYNADGALQVGFDAAGVDQLLSDAGLQVWGRERPLTLVLLPYSTGAAAERQLIERAAQARGLPLSWAAAGADLAAGDLAEVAARHGVDAVLAGRPDTAGSNIFSWTLRQGDTTVETRGTPEDGVHFVADTYAKLFAATPGTAGEALVEVSGISTLDAYAGTLNYLEGLTLVRSVAVDEVAKDSIVFRLALRGDVTVLRRSIALDHRLAPTSPGEGSSGNRLTFRYQP